MARLLLVDDDIAEISAVKRVLARASLAPVLATNAADALAALAQRPADLLLVGATCEGGEAIAMTRRLEEDEATRGLPLIVLGTAPDAPAHAVQLPRPIDPAALAEQVQVLLARRRSAPAPPAAAPAPPQVAGPVSRPAFERRGQPIVLPGPLERRARPSDPAQARRAAAEALRARAHELRRAPSLEPAPAAAEAAAGLDALFEVAQPDGMPPQPAPEGPYAGPGPEDFTAEGGLAPPAEPELQPFAADVAGVAAAPQDDPAASWFEAVPPAPEDPPAPELTSGWLDPAVGAEPPIPETPFDLPPEPELTSGLFEEPAPAPEPGEPAARQAEEAAREQAEARRLLEAEIFRLRAQLESDREAHEVALRSAMARTAAEARAAASVALEALRAQAESEAARRAEAETALARLSEEASRLAAERAALIELGAAATADGSLAPPAGGSLPEPEPSSEPPGIPEPIPSLADVPQPDAAQEAARRRALALRQRREPGEVPPPPAWLQPFEPPPAVEALPPPEQATPEPEPEPLPPAAPPAELRQGNLEDLPAPRLLALAAQARLGGRLDVSGDAARSLWFEGGRVAGAASNAPGERVEEVALRLGLLTREQHRQVAGAAGALASRRAAVLLVERGYLKPAELTALVRRRTEEVVYGIFADGRARFRWVPDPVPADERVAPERPPLALAVEGVRRRWLAPRADAVLGGPASILAPAASPPSAAELGLSPEERRLVSLADGLRTLDEVLALSPLDDLSTRQLLAAAVLTGALTVRVVHAGRPSAQVAAAIDLARVKEKLEQVRRADYFTILGIGRICTPHEVREAADRLLGELALERFPGAREEGLPARLEEMRRVVGDAREVLADDALRAEYLRGLPG